MLEHANGRRVAAALGTLVLAGALHAQAVTDPPLPAPVRQALADTGLPASALSVWVQPVDEATPRLAHLAQQPRQMASVIKLMTTGAALRTLGPAYTWRTPAAMAGRLDARGVLHGDVHLVGSGDPSLDHTRLLSALRAWREAGLNDILGDVVVDRSLFALPAFDPAAFDGEALRPYNAGPDAWLLAHRAVSLRFAPDLARPGALRVTLSPPLAGVMLEVQARLDPRLPCGDWRLGVTLDIPPPAMPGGPRRLKVAGRYPQACGEQWWPLRWPEAELGEHSARLFAAAWRQVGGQLGGRVRPGPWPSGPVTALPALTSPALAEVVRDINKFSNNVMARQLLLALGVAGETPLAGRPPSLATAGATSAADAATAGSATSAASPPGTADTLAQGRAVLLRHVRAATRPATPAATQASGPCEGDALVVDNGAGLSRTEGASAECMGRWLQVMWRDPAMPEWLASLPIAGVDGTARRLDEAVGRAHLKTGSLEGVASLAGVVQDRAGSRHLVVAVINHPRAQEARAVLRAVVGWVGALP